jgi:hypothetical protein
MTELVDAQLYAPLKTTLVPTNGAGNPTFTRATTKNIFDNEGKLITIKSGGITLGGVRCVQNLFTSSIFSVAQPILYSAAWTTGITDVFGGALACRLVESSSASTYHMARKSFSSVEIGYYRYSVYAKAGTRSYVALSAQLDIGWPLNRRTAAAFYLSGSGSVTSTYYSPDAPDATIELISNGWYKITILFRSLVIDNLLIDVCLSDLVVPTWSGSYPTYTGDGESYADFCFPQLENVTGQAIKTASEHISVGISAPYHGAGADGVKYFDTDSSGVAIPDATMLGAHIDPESKTNNLLWCRDLTNAAWVKTNATAAKTQTGIDAVANSCSLLTAGADNATILQTITAASTPACSGFWVKRSVGTGNIFFTRNGGVDWIDITSLINSSTFTCVKIENTSVTNPQVGFKIAASGDAIIVDAGLNHAGTTLTLPIFTTSAAVTRAAEVLTYQTTSNFSDTAGTILATYKPTYDTYASGSIVGSSTRGLYASTSNSGVQALDGTNTINGPTGTPSGQIKIGARWSGSSLQCFALDSFGSAGSYDGGFNLSTIGILPGTAGYIRDLAIWTSSLTDNEIRDAWNLITTYITSGALVGMQSILSSSASSISTVIYGSITATYVQPTLTATYTVPTIEAEI